MSLTLEMPITYTTIAEDEFDDIDGGVVPVLAIIGAVVAVGGSLYAMGQVAGERSYYAGLRNSEYQKYKWNYRAGAVALLGVGGAIFMVGFETKFYEMVTK